MNFIEEYEKKTPGSKKHYDKLKNFMPGGISHNLRYYEPYPVFMVKGEGSHIEDVDGNVYKDLWMGHYSHILGHNPRIIKSVNKNILENGSHLGTVNPYELELAELIIKNIPSVEMLRFCSSGTEATTYAIRLARAYTQKSIVVKIAGGWHGAGSELSKAIKYPYTNGINGIFEKIVDSTKFIFFNNIDESFKVLKEFKDNIACIILEPVIGEGGFLPANREFLLFLREISLLYKSLLIFDEIITGFRMSLGGAQKKFDVYPDLTTLGKIAGGGFNIGVVGGKRDIMELASPFYKGDDKVLIGGGTFSAAPYTMRAGYEMVKFLEENNSEVYSDLEKKGEYVRDSIRKYISEKNINAVVTGTASLYMIHFPFERGCNIEYPSDIGGKTDIYKRENEFKVRLLNKGIHVMHGGGAISYAHSYDDLDLIIEKTCEALSETQMATCCHK